MANPVSASRTDDGPPSRGEPPSTPPPEEAQVVGGLRRLSSSRRHDARAARTRPKRALVPVRPANAIANTERRLDHLQDLPFPGRLSDLLRLHDDPVSSLGGHSHTSWSVSVVAPPQSGHEAWLAGRTDLGVAAVHNRLPSLRRGRRSGSSGSLAGAGHDGKIVPALRFGGPCQAAVMAR